LRAERSFRSYAGNRLYMPPGSSSHLLFHVSGSISPRNALSFLALEGLVLKRTVDVTFSTFLLCLSLPFLACLALIVKLDSPGPAFFRQARMGRRFKRFHLYKLRTMDLGCAGSPYTLGADPRITHCGRWMRRFKLDELPQLWNVLRGDMSLVGPRPVIPELALEFRPGYAGLLKVRPGLTDPASLKYCNEAEILAGVAEPLRYFKTVVTPDKIRISQNYLHIANPWTDLSVAVRTVMALLSLAGRRQIRARRQPQAGRLLHFSGQSRSRRIFDFAKSRSQLPAPAEVIERARTQRPNSGPVSV